MEYLKNIILVILILLAILIPIAYSQSHIGSKVENFQMFMPNYFILGRNIYNSYKEKEVNDVDVEGFTKFQVSFMYDITKIKKHSIFFHYTQISFWNIGQESNPFAEINYHPGLMYNFKFDNKYLNEFRIGVFHESNGESEDRSKSLDIGFQTYLCNKYNFDDFTLNTILRVFYIPDSSLEENPEYHDYMGYQNLYLELRYKEWGCIEFKTLGFIFGGKGAIHLGVVSHSFLDFKNYFTPRLYLQWYCGYGESLINYSAKSNSLRIGIIFRD
jgi:phospholipase A1